MNNKICSTCGEKNLPEASFCQKCGGTLVAKNETGINRCPKCGKENLSGSKFCGGCGSPLQAEIKKDITLCPKCGAENSITSPFCGNCGASLKVIMKKEKENLKAYLWVFPFIGGILAITALLTPVAFSGNYSYISELFWMWGLVVSGFYISGINFDLNLISLLSGIGCTIGIAICGVKLIISANKVRKQGESVATLQKSWRSLAITIIILTIVFIIVRDLSESIELTIRGNFYYITPYGIEFWNSVSIGYGIIGAFIGAGLTIIGVIAYKITKTN